MMTRSLLILFIVLLTTRISTGQTNPGIGTDNNPVVTVQESVFLNSQLKAIKKDTFDFANKKVAYYYSLIGYKQKKDYFIDAKQYLVKGQTMSLQLIVLDESEKKETHGYDVIIVAWYKSQIMRDARAEIIKKLKKYNP